MRPSVANFERGLRFPHLPVFTALCSVPASPGTSAGLCYRQHTGVASHSCLQSLVLGKASCRAVRTFRQPMERPRGEEGRPAGHHERAWEQILP